MEHKIGEIFEFGGEWYQCLESNSYHCDYCDYLGECNKIACTSGERSDDKEVCFKKLEKVGEPFTIVGKLYQHYKVFDIDNVYGDGFFWCVHNYKARTLTIGLKQNKEDMEENHKAEDTLLTRLVGRYVNNLIDYETFEKMVKQLYSDKKDSKPTLKEFDLEAAKAGKPVCTRDGRKVRIICFDSKNDPWGPIVALVEHKDNELLYEYTIEGKDRFSHIGTTGTSDLMMLPEKKEGWVNVYGADTTFYFVEGMVYDTKEEAIKHINPDHEIYTTTVKIEWEE